MSKICFLSSGNGGHFKFMYLLRKYSIVEDVEFFIIADRECGSVEFAKNKGIYFQVVNYSKAHNKELLNELRKINPDIIITNWHKIIDRKTVNLYKGKMINLHYSLLPAFSGLIGIEPIRKAYEQGCKYIGATCHYVDTGVDTGQIISQFCLRREPFEIREAIQYVFQGANLILLNTLIKIFKIPSKIEKKENKKCEYSPFLEFDDEIFNNKFWNELKNI